MSESEIHGHCDEKFAAVRGAFEKNFMDGLELGASYAVSIDGEMVIDLWGGFADVARTRPWKQDTIVPVASSSKVPVSLCGLLLIDRGLIDLDEPIATYWPEFGAGGKQDMPVRYIFCHATGLAGLDGGPGRSVLNNWDEVIRRLSAQEPWWEPGTQSGYHGMTYGHLVGELVKRTTGKTIDAFLKDEITDPLSIDFAFGLQEGSAHRLAEIDTSDGGDQPGYEIPKDSIAWRVMGYQEDLAEDEKLDAFWTLNVPASNGLTNARALARIGSLLAMGGVADGHRFLGKETAALPYREQLYTTDLVFGEPVRWGVGFGMASKEIYYPWDEAFHWGGRGGSGISMVPEVGLAWAYAPNNFMQGTGQDMRLANMSTVLVGRLLAEAKQ